MHLRKQKHIILSAGTRESILSVYPVLLHKKGPPKQLAQTPLSRYLCFLTGSQKKGEGQNALLQDGKKAVFWQGTQHFLHLSQKGTQELSGCGEITAPE